MVIDRHINFGDYNKSSLTYEPIGAIRTLKNNRWQVRISNGIVLDLSFSLKKEAEVILRTIKKKNNVKSSIIKNGINRQRDTISNKNLTSFSLMRNNFRTKVSKQQTQKRLKRLLEWRKYSLEEKQRRQRKPFRKSKVIELNDERWSVKQKYYLQNRTKIKNIKKKYGSEFKKKRAFLKTKYIKVRKSVLKEKKKKLLKLRRCIISL